MAITFSTLFICLWFLYLQIETLYDLPTTVQVRPILCVPCDFWWRATARYFEMDGELLFSNHELQTTAADGDIDYVIEYLLNGNNAQVNLHFYSLGFIHASMFMHLISRLGMYHVQLTWTCK